MQLRAERHERTPPICRIHSRRARAANLAEARCDRASAGQRSTLLLADEPTGNLDSVTANAVLELFADLNGEGRTIVVVSHESDIRSIAQRQVRLQDGRVIDDVRDRPRVA